MAKLNQIEVNGTTYDLQDKSIFTGTQSEVNSAISNGTIKEGDIVNITDDVGENSGGVSNIVYLTQEEYDALPESKLTDGVEYRITDANTDNTKARNIAYDNSMSGIEATSVQDAIDTVNESLKNLSIGEWKLLYNNVGGVTAIDLSNLDYTELNIKSFWYNGTNAVYSTALSIFKDDVEDYSNKLVCYQNTDSSNPLSRMTVNVQNRIITAITFTNHAGTVVNSSATFKIYYK